MGLLILFNLLSGLAVTYVAWPCANFGCRCLAKHFCRKIAQYLELVLFMYIISETRVVTIRYPHDTIRIAILESRYDTYRDTSENRKMNQLITIGSLYCKL